MTVCRGVGTRIGCTMVGYNGRAGQLPRLCGVSQYRRSQYRWIPFLLWSNKGLRCRDRRRDNNRRGGLFRSRSSHRRLQGRCCRRSHRDCPINGTVRRRRRTFASRHHCGVRGWRLYVRGVLATWHILHAIVCSHYNVTVLRLLLVIGREEGVILEGPHVSCAKRRRSRCGGGRDSRIASVCQVIWSGSPSDCRTFHADSEHCNDEHGDEQDDSNGAANDGINGRLYKYGTNFRVGVFRHSIRRLQDYTVFLIRFVGTVKYPITAELFSNTQLWFFANEMVFIARSRHFFSLLMDRDME